MAYLKKSMTTAIAVAVGVCFSIAFLITSEMAHYRLTHATQDFNRSIEAKGLLREIGGVIHEAEAAQRAYFLTRQTDDLLPWQTSRDKIDRIAGRLTEIWQDQPDQLVTLHALTDSAHRRLADMDDALVQFRKAGRFGGAKTLGLADTEQLVQQADAALASESLRYQDGMRHWQSNVLVARIGVEILSTVNLVLLLLLYTRSRREQRRAALDVQEAELRRIELERQVEERTAVLSELSSDLQIEQEREKAKIAHDIHDELGSLIISTRMDVTYVMFKLRSMNQALADKLEVVIQCLDACVNIKRRIIEELRPTVLDTMGISPAIEWQVHQVCERAGITPVLTLDADLPPMPEGTGIALFRITQEALTNIVKYAKASHVQVSLQLIKSNWELTVQDDGIGLSEGAVQNPLSHGIAGMRQRVVALRGLFTISSEPGKGTTIHIRVPYVPMEEETNMV